MMWGGTKVEGVLNSCNITKLCLGNVNYVHYGDGAHLTEGDQLLGGGRSRSQTALKP